MIIEKFLGFRKFKNFFGMVISAAEQAHVRNTKGRFSHDEAYMKLKSWKKKKKKMSAKLIQGSYCIDKGLISNVTR